MGARSLSVSSKKNIFKPTESAQRNPIKENSLSEIGVDPESQKVKALEILFQIFKR